MDAKRRTRVWEGQRWAHGARTPMNTHRSGRILPKTKQQEAHGALPVLVDGPHDRLQAAGSGSVVQLLAVHQGQEARMRLVHALVSQRRVGAC